jgi:hypothetical protein
MGNDRSPGYLNPAPFPSQEDANQQQRVSRAVSPCQSIHAPSVQLNGFFCLSHRNVKIDEENHFFLFFVNAHY